MKKYEKICFLQELLEAKANVNFSGPTGRGPSRGLQCGHVKCVRLLVDGNADLELEDEEGVTGLMEAASLESPECLKVMIGAKADVNHPGDRHLQTGLHWACKYGSVECAQLLIDAKADVILQCPNGDTGLAVAALEGHNDCLKLMIGAVTTADDPDHLIPSTLSHALIRSLTSPAFSVTGREYENATLITMLLLRAGAVLQHADIQDLTGQSGARLDYAEQRLVETLRYAN